MVRKQESCSRGKQSRTASQRCGFGAFSLPESRLLCEAAGSSHALVLFMDSLMKVINWLRLPFLRGTDTNNRLSRSAFPNSIPSCLSIHPTSGMSTTMTQPITQSSLDIWQYYAIENLKFIQSSAETRMAVVQTDLLQLPPALPHSFGNVGAVYRTDATCVDSI